MDVSETLVRRIYSTWPAISETILDMALTDLGESNSFFPTKLGCNIIDQICENIVRAEWDGI